MRLRAKPILLISIAFSMTWSVNAEESSPERGFHFDPKTNRYFSSKKSEFSIRPVEDAKFVENIEISIDGSEFSRYEGKLKFDEEGVRRIRFRAVDPVLNWSPVQDFKLYVDVTPPKSSPVWQGPQHQGSEMFFVSAQSVISVNVQDQLSGVYGVFTREENVNRRFKNGVVYKKEGEYSLRLKAIDNVGNEEAWYDFKFTVDTSAPRTKADIQGNFYDMKAGRFVSSGSQIVLHSKDQLSGVERVEYQINGGPVTQYIQPIGVNQAKFDLRYRAVDFVGNTERWRSLTIYQDNTAPSINLEKNGKHLAFGGRLFARPGFKFNVSAKDQGSGLKQIQYSLNDGDFKNLSGETIPFSQPGTYYLRIVAMDQVGNERESNPYFVVVDSSPPTTDLSSSREMVERDGVLLSAIPNRLKLDAADKASGIMRTEVSYDGKKFTEYRQPIDMSQWSSARRTVYYRSIDRLGNVEKVKKVTVSVRNNGPKVDLFVESGKLPEVSLSVLNAKYGGAEPSSQPVAAIPAPKKSVKSKVKKERSKVSKKKSVEKRKVAKKKSKRKNRKPASKKSRKQSRKRGKKN